MGWTFTHRESGQTDLEWFRKEFPSIEILVGATVRSVFYAACKRKDDDTVWALVCMIKRVPRDHYNFGYKDMDETCGPCDCLCPEKILNLLSPLPPAEPETGYAWAAAWRQRCRENIAKRAGVKIKPGTVIRFKHAISFTNGDKVDIFQWAKRSTFYSMHATSEGHLVRSMYGTYRIRNWKDREFEVVA